MFEVKCKHCLKVLFTDENTSWLNSHGEIKSNPTKRMGCNPDADIESCMYISADNVPDWISKIIDQESWTKGRLNCPHCNNRLGSFNFVNEIKCDCGNSVIPPIKIIWSKVDIFERYLPDNESAIT